MIKCITCGRKTAPLTHLQGWKLCRVCYNAWLKAYRDKRRVQGKQVCSTKRNEAHRRQWQVEYQQRPDVRKRRAEQMRRYQHDPKLRIKHLARWYTRRQIANGIIQRQPCAECGTSPAQAHHEDYTQPLLIVWLCALCHRKLHYTASQGTEE